MSSFGKGRLPAITSRISLGSKPSLRVDEQSRGGLLLPQHKEGDRTTTTTLSRTAGLLHDPKSGVVVDVVMDVLVVCVGGDEKDILVFRPAHRCFVAHPVCLLRSDLSRHK